MSPPTDLVLDSRLPPPPSLTRRSASRAGDVRAWLLRLWHRVSPVRLAVAMLSALQPETAARFGAWIGDLVWQLGIRRSVTSANIALVSSVASGSRRRRLGRQSYRTMGANFAEIWSNDCEALKAKVEILNPTWLNKVHDGHRGG